MKNMSEYASYIDHTCLSSDASEDKIIKLCEEAKKYGFYSVCVNPYYINLAKKILADTNVKVCAVIGFPLGQNTTSSKVFETKDAINSGANEIDMVINISKLKDKDVDYCVSEINEIKKACGNNVLKVIVETCLLTEQEKQLACEIVLKSDAEFIKTSTGFSTGGATVEDITLFKKCLGDKKLIKAAGGIKNSDDLIKMIDAGADRIGTSRGVMLMTNKEDNLNTY
ncbi:deoxyribose-phosphate aldolase [Malacoplasma iowae]|nr:deoxyribose-phosphate aldolase [Malacoplasma iowae]